MQGRVLNLPPAKGQDEEPAVICASLLAACSKVRTIRTSHKNANLVKNSWSPDKPSSRRKAQMRLNYTSAPDRNDW